MKFCRSTAQSWSANELFLLHNPAVRLDPLFFKPAPNLVRISKLHYMPIIYVFFLQSAYLILNSSSWQVFFHNNLNWTMQRKWFLLSWCFQHQRNLQRHVSDDGVEWHSRISWAVAFLEDHVSTCLPASNNWISNHEFAWLAQSLSCFMLAFMQFEIKPDLDGSEPLELQQMCGIMAEIEHFPSLAKYAIGKMAWYTSCLSIICLFS